MKEKKSFFTLKHFVTFPVSPERKVLQLRRQRRRHRGLRLPPDPGGVPRRQRRPCAAGAQHDAGAGEEAPELGLLREERGAGHDRQRRVRRAGKDHLL